jgi:putative sigma-54 modulation protein
MLVSIRGEAIRLNQRLTDYVHRGLMFSLGRFFGRIRRVKVTISDVNGLRGGDDKRCRICVDMGVLGIVVVEDTDAAVSAAIDNAAERASRVVKRKIECANERRKRAFVPGTRAARNGVGMTRRVRSLGIPADPGRQR